MIRRLDASTIGKIAAGEVVERPSSVVKELLENAFDAGAGRIVVEIAGAGIDLIRVVDDGCGIAPSDLPLAIERHATSKLATDDLTRISTLGFRGEALASIAAVSDMRIVSTCAGEPSGGELHVEFGAIRPSSAAAAPQGTSVTVRDLFGNVPARRKFLKQPSTELGAIQRVVGAYAAARPDVAVTLISDGKQLFATDGQGDLIAAATSVFGTDIGSAALMIGELEDHAAVPGVAVRGWVCGPSQHKAHRQALIVFINGRLISHRSLSYAVEEAYHTLLLVGRHPVTLHLIDVDPEQVDVNVHPTKAEVRFLDERAVCRAAQRATHAALAAAPRDLIPEVGFATVAVQAEPSPAFQSSFQATHQVGSAGRAETESAVERPQPSVPMLRVLGQVATSYIIAEGPDGLYLIDQHAAHERVMYEAIQRQLEERSVDAQPYLDPLMIELDATEAAVMDRSIEELRVVGFDIEPFGEGTYVIRAVPAIMSRVDIRERLHDILGELADGGSGDSWLDSVAISAACHTSIRAGQPLSLSEMRELVQQLEATRHPRACGHGRPTMLRMTQGELEKQFARR